MTATSRADGHDIEYRSGQWVYKDNGEPVIDRPCKKCNQTTIPLRLLISTDQSHTGHERWDTIKIDACIAPLVQALSNADIHMFASCCGHGNKPGNILLADGRVLTIFQDLDEYLQKVKQ